MLYSFYGELEENYDYGLADGYTYGNDAQSVEDGWIITENGAGKGKRRVRVVVRWGFSFK